MNDPFRPNFPRPNTFKMVPFDMNYKLDYCMKKISELEQRIYQLEREKNIRLDPISEITSGVLQSSIHVQNDINME